MGQDQALLTILAIALVANLLLLVSVPFQARRAQRARQAFRQEVAMPADAGRLDALLAPPRADESVPPPVPVSPEGPLSDDDVRAAAAIEAFVSGVSTDIAGRSRPPTPEEIAARHSEFITAVSPETTTIPVGPGVVGGLGDPAAWNQAVRDESARVARFARPVTVVMAQLAHLGDIADRLGPDVADRVATQTARLLVRNGRASDRIARLDDAVFGVLLVETDEAGATGYADRVRADVDRWLESAGLSLRLSLGWASPPEEGGDIVAATAAARQRMRGEDPGSPAT